ncbi:hypothetical protein [Mucilaginibacter ginsenosidivorans]|uniref:Uncharacterized protein n=1 Tax=Mucilaginibacter ginsenosidivorans TaxID=398053 RepID=A0A5B8UWV4_9SPHI|nr:hypothetical protein [Mucilaginibacter ginsenosidivorans]QEC62876.1 hypothetical protein FRZ54_09895 [Mucilaginibacter ginsenosidivorans]
MIPSAAGQKTLTVLKKYGLFLCLPVFLFIAYSYTSGHRPQYKATAKIELNGISPDEAIDDIRSKPLLQKALDRLGYRISYYNTRDEDHEINGDSLPVKIVFSQFNTIDDDIVLTFKTASPNTFTLTHGDTIAYEEFNKPAKTYYGTFKVTHREGTAYQDASFLFRLHDPVELIDRYYNSLQVKAEDDAKVLSVSAASGTPKKSAALVNKLLQLYGGTKHSIPATGKIEQPEKEKNAPEVQRADAEKIAKNITMLREKAARLRHQVGLLTPKAQKPVIDSEQMHAYDAIQMDVFKAIMPYMRKPVDQFVQVPYIDEIYDMELKKELTAYNAMQLRKQRALANPEQNKIRLDTFDNKMMFLQSEIVDNITFLRQQHSPDAVVEHHGNPSLLKAKKDSLDDIITEITKEKRQYAAIHTTPVPVQHTQQKAHSAISRPGLVVLDKPESNIEYVAEDPFWVYAIAVFAGLLIPLTVLVISNNRYNARLTRRANAQTLAEKLNDLFAVKQID